MTAELIEIIWSVQMLCGLVAASIAAFLVTGDLHFARLHDGSTQAELETGIWNVILWIGSAIVNMCLLLIGIQALTLPTPAGRTDNATFTGLCFIVAGIVLAATPVGYLVYRWYVLRHKEE